MPAPNRARIIEAYGKIAAGQGVTLDAPACEDLTRLIRRHVRLGAGSGGSAVCPECGPLRWEAGGGVTEGHTESCRLAPFLPYPPTS